jgi:multiple sugar transport system substrate-binding protein
MVDNNRHREALASRPPRPNLPFKPLAQASKGLKSLDSNQADSPKTASSGYDNGNNEGSKFSSGSWARVLVIIFLLILVGTGSYYFFFLRKGSPSGGLSSSGVVLDYWGLWEPESVMNGLISEFEKDNPGIRVKYTQATIIDYRKRLQSALASGNGPDIFRIHNTWLPMFIDDLAPVPNDLAGSLSLENNYYPVIKESLFSQGNFYGIPLMIDTLALFYNKDIFDQYQLSPPQDWDRFRQIASQLTIRDEEKRVLQAGAAMGAASNIDHWSDILGLMIIQNGAPIAGPYGDDAKQALDFFLVFTGKDQVWDETLPDSTRAFAGGKLALYFAPSWRIVNLYEINPDLNFGVVTVPQLPEREPVAWATFWAEGVSIRADKVKQEAAWKFLEFLSQEESLERMFRAGSQVHYIGQLYPRIDMADRLASDPLLAPFINQAVYARSWHLASQTADDGLNDGIIKYFEDAVNRSLLGAEPELETTVTQGVTSILSKYQVSRL